MPEEAGQACFCCLLGSLCTTRETDEQERPSPPLILVALLVAGNLLVLARDTLHEGVELEVVRLGDGFWLLCGASTAQDQRRSGGA